MELENEGFSKWNGGFGTLNYLPAYSGYLLGELVSPQLLIKLSLFLGTRFGQGHFDLRVKHNFILILPCHYDVLSSLAVTVYTLRTQVHLTSLKAEWDNRFPQSAISRSHPFSLRGKTDWCRYILLGLGVPQLDDALWSATIASIRK